ncbi:MAG: T9SS type A sorting domain-containing protein [Bacteroidia bacterium]|nr:T9SS type A sorting domain-containing protein [Bacteroidia bacterium]
MLNNNTLQITVRNYLGMEVLKFTPDKNQIKNTFDISGFASGIYSVEIRSGQSVGLKKLVID